DFNHLTDLQMEMFINCWKFNLKNFRNRWMQGESGHKGREFLNRSVTKALFPSLYLLYYRKHHDKFAKYIKDFLLTASGYTPVNVSKKFRIDQLKIPNRYI
ncbi:MAG: hypothetical protein ACFFDN_20185, partial [Candidatus Hodarchaeota archaeon]